MEKVYSRAQKLPEKYIVKILYGWDKEKFENVHLIYFFLFELRVRVKVTSYKMALRLTYSY